MGDMQLSDVLFFSISAALALTGSLSLLLFMPAVWMKDRRLGSKRRFLLAALAIAPPSLLSLLIGAVAAACPDIRLWLDDLARLTNLHVAQAVAVLAASLATASTFFLLASNALARSNRRLEQAARTMGVSRFRLWWNVILPPLRRRLGLALVFSWGRAFLELGVTLILFPSMLTMPTAFLFIATVSAAWICGMAEVVIVQRRDRGRLVAHAEI